MRIGIDASFLRKPGTGIGQVTLHFLKTLSELPEASGHTYTLYLDEAVGTWDWPENFEQRVFLPWWKRDDVPRKWLWEKKAAQVARTDGCDAFISLSQAATIFPRNFSHVMVVHDLIPFLFPEYIQKLSQRFYYRDVKKALLAAPRIVAVSQSTKKDLESFGRRGEDIAVAYEGVNRHFGSVPTEERVREVLSKYHIDPGYIYHGGGLEIRKNTEGVLRAYRLLLDRNISSLPKLVISGRVFSESNSLATPVKQLIRELGLEGRVILTDFIPADDLPCLYRGARLFVFPSRYEGFGLPVLEALSMETPVITARNSSLPEVGGDAVLYVDHSNTEELALALEKLLTDEPLRRELISKSRAQALQFDWQRFTRAVFSRVLPPL